MLVGAVSVEWWGWKPDDGVRSEGEVRKERKHTSPGVCTASVNQPSHKTGWSGEARGSSIWKGHVANKGLLFGREGFKHFKVFMGIFQQRGRGWHPRRVGGNWSSLVPEEVGQVQEHGGRRRQRRKSRFRCRSVGCQDGRKCKEFWFEFSDFPQDWRLRVRRKMVGWEGIWGRQRRLELSPAESEWEGRVGPALANKDEFPVLPVREALPNPSVGNQTQHVSFQMPSAPDLPISFSPPSTRQCFPGRNSPCLLLAVLCLQPSPYLRLCPELSHLTLQTPQMDFVEVQLQSSPHSWLLKVVWYPQARVQAF